MLQCSYCYTTFSECFGCCVSVDLNIILYRFLLYLLYRLVVAQSNQQKGFLAKSAGAAQWEVYGT
jgi:hypothetical protein